MGIAVDQALQTFLVGLNILFIHGAVILSVDLLWDPFQVVEIALLTMSTTWNQLKTA